jgi:zinc/manganese transport system ATP-binding protein
MHHPLLEFRGVSFTYGEGAVLRDVELTIREGSFCGIVGPSGAGKTTLLRLMDGSLRPSVGSLVRGRHDGRPLRLGVVPQLETIDWNFPITVEEVALLGMTGDGRRLPWASKAMRARAGAILERLGIGELARRHIRNLSGGQQQRAFIARALIRHPDLLILDEPTSGVDVRTRHDILHLLHELNHEDITIVMTTHDLNAVAAHLPSLVCVNGRVLAQGTPEQVLTPGVLRELYGAEMVVIRREGMLLVGDAFSATVDVHDRAAHPESTPPAHFGDEPPPHQHGPQSDHRHEDVNVVDRDGTLPWEAAP